MGSLYSTVEPFEDHMEWIEENLPWVQETVVSFRRSVPRNSAGYKRVEELYKWQVKHCIPDEKGYKNPGHVADILGAMRMATASVKVNRVDVF